MRPLKELTAKQQAYVKHMSKGLSSRVAAEAAGFSKSYALSAGSRLKKNPLVAEALAEIRQEGREQAVFGIVQAMAEAADTMQFARETKNANAYCKAVELRAKLSGLLIERVEVFSADLRGALEEAKTRIVNAVALPDRGPSGKDN